MLCRKTWLALIAFALAATAAAQDPGAITGPLVPQRIWVKAGRRAIAPERTQLAETKAQAQSLSQLAANSALSSALQSGVGQVANAAAVRTGFGSGITGSAISGAGGIFSGVMANRKPTATFVWALAGGSAADPPLGTSSTFEVNYAGVPNINPTDYDAVLLRLSPTSANWRLVGATRAKEDRWQSSTPDWQVYANFIEDRVPVSVQRIAPGHVRLSPSAPLPPGQYAIALRPVSKNKKFAPSDLARSEGAGLLFNTAWPFSVR